MLENLGIAENGFWALFIVQTFRANLQSAAILRKHLPITRLHLHFYITSDKSQAIMLGLMIDGEQQAIVVSAPNMYHEGDSAKKRVFQVESVELAKRLYNKIHWFLREIFNGHGWEQFVTAPIKLLDSIEPCLYFRSIWISRGTSFPWSCILWCFQWKNWSLQGFYWDTCWQVVKCLTGVARCARRHQTLRVLQWMKTWTLSLMTLNGKCMHLCLCNLAFCNLLFCSWSSKWIKLEDSYKSLKNSIYKQKTVIKFKLHLL